MNSSVSFLSLSSVFSASPAIRQSEHVFLRSVGIFKSFAPLIKTRFPLGCLCLRADQILNSAIAMECVDISSVSYSSQYLVSSSAFFVRCVFSNVSVKTSQGSAIYCTSGYSINLTSCEFSDCQAVTSPCAGAIYTTGSISSKMCCFIRCYKNYEGDEKFTNAIYCLGAIFTLNQSYFLSCGLTNSGAGDSTNYVPTAFCTVSLNNVTKCFGYQGGALIRVGSTVAGSTFQYIAVTQCGQYSAFEDNGSNHIYIINFNVVNNSNFIGYWMTFVSSTATLTNALFSKNNAPYAYIYSSSSSVTLVNCVSDVSFSGVTYVSGATALDFGIGSTQACEAFSAQFSDVLAKIFGMRNALSITGLLLILN